MNRRKEGSIYEDLAAEYLKSKGYKLIARNYHNRFGELDIIALGDIREYNDIDLWEEWKSTIPKNQLLADFSWEYRTDAGRDSKRVSKRDTGEDTWKDPQKNDKKDYEENDILMLPPGTFLLICEVKYKKNGEFGDPADAVTRSKIRHICRTALGFYMEYGLCDDFPCRFDVISVNDNLKIRHITDAFPCTF